MFDDETAAAVCNRIGDRTAPIVQIENVNINLPNQEILGCDSERNVAMSYRLAEFEAVVTQKQLENMNLRLENQRLVNTIARDRQNIFHIRKMMDKIDVEDLLNKFEGTRDLITAIHKASLAQDATEGVE